MRTRISSILWFIAALIFIKHGIELYWRYSMPEMLWLVIVPETIAVKWTLFGAISFLIGVGILMNQKKTVRFVFSVPFWLLLFTILSIFHELLISGDFLGWANYIFDYLIFVPFIVTKCAISMDKLQVDKQNIFIFYKKNWLIMLIYGIITYALILLIATLLPYEAFGFLYK